MEVDEFFLYHLFREELSKKEYTSFVGWKKHIQSLNAINPIQYRCLTENKLTFYAYCLVYNISTPRVFAVYDPQIPAMNMLKTLHTVDELLAFINSENISEFVLKPTEGTRGQSILVVKYDKSENTFKNITGTLIEKNDLERVLNQYNYRGSSQSGFLVQQRLTPHESTIQFSKNVPFSYRVLTILDENNEPEIIEIYAKASVGESDTDNWEGGGLTLRLDEKGVCYGANSLDSRFDLFFYHPTNNFSFIKWQAPFYKEVCELGIQCAKAFHYVKCVAWDIITSKEGIYVIEGNNPFSVGQQEVYFRGLWQGTFAQEAEKAIKNGPNKSPWW
jgi:hypothetical protein